MAARLEQMPDCTATLTFGLAMMAIARPTVKVSDRIPHRCHVQMSSARVIVGKAMERFPRENKFTFFNSVRQHGHEIQ